MKTNTPRLVRNVAAFLGLLFILTSVALSQPQYYNFNTTTRTNIFPFGVILGKQVQLLYLAGDFNQPLPAPSGDITKIYFMMRGTVTVTHTNLLIKMGQATGLTTFPAGAWYTGQLDTFYYRASVQLSSTTNQWMSITLDRPFNYDNTKSLIIDITTCAASATGMDLATTLLENVRRNTSLIETQCPFVWGQQSGTINNMGIDIAPVLTLPNADNQVPSKYSLEQNYPNPFNPTTNIKFSITSTELVKLVVFDVLGREVATLVNEVKSAGNYTTDFDASHLSSGVYFYRLESGNFTQTKMMLLVK